MNESSKLATEPYVFDGPPHYAFTPTIALCVMTKDGAAKLPRLFESVKGFADKAIVLDTSNNHDTFNWLAEQHILPVEVYRKPFVNFEVSRNQLFELAKGRADWLLLLDDDMALNFTGEKGALKVYGTGRRPEFDPRRV